MPERNPQSPKPSDQPAYLARAIDARAMKAFAHPLRMAMYDYLNDHGSATATMLAHHTGESTGQTSYHLRQLERHGFVEEDAGRGSGRERWWRSLGFSMEGGALLQDSTARQAVVATLQHQIASRAQSLAEWFDRAVHEDLPWQDASLNSRTTALMTAEEAAELNAALMSLTHEHLERTRERHGHASGATTGDDVRRVRLYIDLFPLPRDDS